MISDAVLVGFRLSRNVSFTSRLILVYSPHKDLALLCCLGSGYPSLYSSNFTMVWDWKSVLTLIARVSMRALTWTHVRFYETVGGFGSVWVLSHLPPTGVIGPEARRWVCQLFGPILRSIAAHLSFNWFTGKSRYSDGYYSEYPDDNSCCWSCVVV